MITVFGEGRGFRVVWLLEEMGLAYRLRDVDLLAGVENDHAFLAVNPAGFIPALQDGDVTMVEFFDYNCGYCKRAFPDMEALSTEDKDLRVVYKEFPILGPDSQKAHLVSMAFRTLMPEKWDQFHHTLFPNFTLTGTPEGVILGRSPKVWMKAGDSMTVEVGPLGKLTNAVVAE